VSEEWTLPASLADGSAQVRAVVSASAWRPGLVLRSMVNMPKRGSEPRSSHDDAIAAALLARGYLDPNPEQPSETRYLARALTRFEFARERSYLAKVLGHSETSSSVRPSGFRGFTDSFGRGGASSWAPYRAAWEVRRPIELVGRRAEVILMVHLAPRDLRGLSLGLSTSVAIWPPWQGRGTFPEWLASRRRLLAGQFRAVGHKAEWYRGPGGRGVGIMSLVFHRPPHRIAERLRALELAEFGDQATALDSDRG